MGSKDIVREFTVCGNRVTVHMPAHCAGEARPDADEGRSGETSPALPDSLPAVYLHVHDGDGSEVLQLCRELGYREFVLATIRPRCWNDNLTPWECPGLFADDAPFAGKAAEQLRLLESQIIPRVEGGAPRKPEQRVLAGYSLAGLFATWATFNSTAFGRVASASDRCGTRISPAMPLRTSSHASPPAHISRLAARRRARPAGFCATWHKARAMSSTCSKPKACPLSSSKTPATTSRNPPYVWQRASPGR